MVKFVNKMHFAAKTMLYNIKSITFWQRVFHGIRFKVKKIIRRDDE